MSQDLQEKMDREVSDFNEVVKEIESLMVKREQIRGRVQLLEQLIEESRSEQPVQAQPQAQPEVVTGQVVN